MKTKYYIIISLILLVLVFWLGRSCAPEPKATDKTSVIKAGIKSDTKKRDDKQSEIDILNKIAENKDSLIEKVHKPKWKQAKDKAKNDSIPCKERIVTLVQACDSLVAQFDSLNAVNKRVKLEQDSLKQINDSLAFKYRLVVRTDSLTIDSLTRSRKKFWRGFKVGFVLGNITGAVGAGSMLR